MRSRTPLYMFLGAAIVLSTVHIVSLELSFYWQYRWLDMPVHFLAGAMLGFFPFVVRSLGFSFVARYTGFVPVILFVVLVGLLWEVFEIWVGLPLIEHDFERDIALDLVMDILGGCAGYIIGSKLTTG